ncbi:hypothetical protein [Terriglobus aquaticus]|uniref:Uncharacterized protein n=1 Tax=Terriglobus aquaticus TaxID=940139 RepID=A0ABW9KIA0_9BACT|nr:hypothetical protein [Terriglobus aquaticus]
MYEFAVRAEKRGIYIGDAVRFVDAEATVDVTEAMEERAHSLRSRQQLRITIVLDVPRRAI